jgi:hypothetical protein
MIEANRNETAAEIKDLELCTGTICPTRGSPRQSVSATVFRPCWHHNPSCHRGSLTDIGPDAIAALICDTRSRTRLNRDISASSSNWTPVDRDVAGESDEAAFRVMGTIGVLSN